MEFRWWEIINGEQAYFLIATNTYLARLDAQGEAADSIVADLENGQLPRQGLEQLTFDQLQSIEIDESQPAIKGVSLHGQEETVFPIVGGQQRFEIFDYLNKNSPHQGYELVKSSGLAQAKWPILAVVLLSTIFGYAYYVADQSEQSVEIHGQIAFFLDAMGLGTRTLSLVYLGIIGLAFMILFRKLLQPGVRHVLRYA